MREARGARARGPECGGSRSRRGGRLSAHLARGIDKEQLRLARRAAFLSQLVPAVRVQV